MWGLGVGLVWYLLDKVFGSWSQLGYVAEDNPELPVLLGVTE